jgi:uncharacterized protein YjbJ (UPF0337 family)
MPLDATGDQSVQPKVRARIGTRQSAAQPLVVTARAVATGNARSTAMSGKIDTIKGRIKEAVGALTDNDDLKREGQRDQALGEVKEAAERAAEKVKDTVERTAEKVKDTVKRAVDKVKNA